MVKLATNSFNPVLAEEYGIEEALLLNNFNLWTSPAKDNPNERTYYDGRYWVQISLKELNYIFNYMSINSIRRAISNLEAKELILKNDFNNSYFEKTLWYALSDKAISMCEYSHNEMCKSTNNIIYIPSYYNSIETNKLYIIYYNNIDKKGARAREILDSINDFAKKHPSLVKTKGYGKYGNIFLTSKEFELVQKHFPNPSADIPWDVALDAVSSYLFNHPEVVRKIDCRYYHYVTEVWNYNSAVKNYKASLGGKATTQAKPPKRSDKYTKEQMDSLFTNLDEVKI